MVAGTLSTKQLDSWETYTGFVFIGNGFHFGMDSRSKGFMQLLHPTPKVLEHQSYTVISS